MLHTIIIAGLYTQAFDHIRRISSNRIAPDGNLVMTPNHGNGIYSIEHADDLLKNAVKIAAKIDASQPFSTLLLYTDFKNESTSQFLKRFFPFCLPLAIPPLVLIDGKKNSRNAQLNEFSEIVLTGAQQLRKRSRLISTFTTVANLTPLLLPIRNFRSEALDQLLRTLFYDLGTTGDVEKSIGDAVSRFTKACPWTHAPDDPQRCFSDGRHYFKSPGRSRHGHFRNDTGAGHSSECFLNARSRLGGPYSHKLHYDCIPTRGTLLKAYPNCHGHLAAPNARHVNIAPSDFII